MKQVLCLSSLVQEEPSLPACPADDAIVLEEKENDRDLGQSQRLSLDELPQKNTFIHYDIPCDRPPTPTASAPGVLLSRLFKTKNQSNAMEVPMHSSFSTESVLSSLADKSTIHGDFENDSQASTSAADSNVGTPVEMNATLTAGLAIDVKARAEEIHRLGQCTPCNYYWYKVDGCRQGSACDFCHLCPKGEIKKRKKDKVRQMRKTVKPVGFRC